MASWANAAPGDGPRAEARRPSVRCSIFHCRRCPSVAPLYVFYLEKIMPRIAGLLTGAIATTSGVPCQSIERFPCGKDLEALLTANGFSSATTKPLELRRRVALSAGRR